MVGLYGPFSLMKFTRKNVKRKNKGENFSLDTMDDTIELRLTDGGPPGPLPPVRV